MCGKGALVSLMRATGGLRNHLASGWPFFDDDQLAEPNWLRELLKSASKLGTSCVGGSRKLYLSKQRYSELSPICKTILGEIKLGNEQLKYNGKNFPCTGNVLIKNTVFDTVGLFNELMKWGGSDLDFFRKARMAGIEAWYTPKAVVHHVIPSYRLSEDYLIWRSLLTGNNFAIINYREWGLVKTTLACIARMGQAVLVNMPLLFWTYLSGDDVERLGRKCLLCRAVGYMRQTVYLLAPGLFTQKRFLAQLEFRKERTSFLKESNLAENKYHKI